ncbi:wax ester/triacylglycerol synthase domain-containing protein [Streptomyces sp. L7]
MTSDLLAPLDLAFWNIESDRNPMHLGALGVFSAHSPTAGAHAADLLAARAAAVPGLRMRIRDVWQPLSLSFGSATREEDPDFDPLHHVRLHAPTADFQEVAGRLMERPLERGRPPWEAHVLPGEDGVSFAVLFKFHHALADGLRALTLAAAILDPMDMPERRPRPRSRARAPARCAQAARAAAGRPVRRRPGPRHRGVRRRSTLDVRSSVALASEPSGTRRTAGVVVDLDDVHRIRKTVGGTVNDVLIAVVAGALAPLARRTRRRQRRRRAPRPDPRLQTPPRSSSPQGNRLSGYLIRLPVDDPDPLARLRLRARRPWTATRTPAPTGAPAPSPCSPTTYRRSVTGSADRSPRRRPGSGSTSWSPASRCPASV